MRSCDDSIIQAHRELHAGTLSSSDPAHVRTWHTVGLSEHGSEEWRLPGLLQRSLPLSGLSFSICKGGGASWSRFPDLSPMPQVHNWCPSPLWSSGLLHKRACEVQLPAHPVFSLVSLRPVSSGQPAPPSNLFTLVCLASTVADLSNCLRWACNLYCFH